MANLNIIETGGLALGGNEIVTRELIIFLGAETGGLSLGGTEVVNFVMPVPPPVTAVTDIGGLVLGGSEAVGVVIPGQRVLMPGVSVPESVPGGAEELPVPAWLADLIGMPQLIGGLIIGGQEPVNIVMPPVLTVVE